MEGDRHDELIRADERRKAEGQFEAMSLQRLNSAKSAFCPNTRSARLRRRYVHNI